MHGGWAHGPTCNGPRRPERRACGSARRRDALKAARSTYYGVADGVTVGYARDVGDGAPVSTTVGEAITVGYARAVDDGANVVTTAGEAVRVDRAARTGVAINAAVEFGNFNTHCTRACTFTVFGAVGGKAPTTVVCIPAGTRTE